MVGQVHLFLTNFFMHVIIYLDVEDFVGEVTLGRVLNTFII